MKKSRIIILAIAVLVLSASIWLLTRDNTKTEAEEDASVTYLEVKTLQEDITKISLVNTSGVFAFEKKDEKWQNVFTESVEASGNAIYAIESILEKTWAIDEIEKDVESLGKYGLDKPSAVAKYTTAEGNTGFLKLGNSIVGTKCYFTVDDKNVYTMDIVESGVLLAGMSAFVDMSLTDIKLEELEEAEFFKNGEKIRVVKKNATEIVEGKADSLFAYKLVSPVRENASPENVQKFFTMLSAISASEYDPYADDEACGFDGEEKYFSYATARETGKFIVGNAAEQGYTYVKVKGVKGAYKVSNEAISFMDYTAFDLVDKHISLFYLDEISKIIIETSDEKYELAIGNDITINGRSIDKDAAQEFYRSLISLTYDGSVEKEIKNPVKEVSITFVTADGKETTGYVSYDAMNYAVLRNGDMEFTIQNKYVEKILSLIKEL